MICIFCVSLQHHERPIASKLLKQSYPFSSTLSEFDIALNASNCCLKIAFCIFFEFAFTTKASLKILQTVTVKDSTTPSLFQLKFSSCDYHAEVPAILQCQMCSTSADHLMFDSSPSTEHLRIEGTEDTLKVLKSKIESKMARERQRKKKIEEDGWKLKMNLWYSEAENNVVKQLGKVMKRWLENTRRGQVGFEADRLLLRNLQELERKQITIEETTSSSYNITAIVGENFVAHKGSEGYQDQTTNQEH
ncbi:hypothetical protein Tco_1200534 [Tanacetum coccineum]